jgi:hypothetical protein
MNEPSPHEGDLLDEAVAAMRRMPTPERPPDSLVLESLHHSEQLGPRPLPNTLFEKVLRMHPYVRYGIVALVGSVLLLIGFGTHSNALLLADVMKAVAKHKTVKFESPGRRPPITRTIYGTLDQMHARTENSRGNFTIFDRAKGIFLTVFPKQKTAVLNKFAGKKSDVGFLQTLEKLENDKQTTSTQERLDGLDVVVYRLTKEGVKSTIWVDRHTMLPVRVEDEFLRGPIAGEKTTMTGFVWDPPIPDPEKFFSVEPPAGYEVTTRNLFRTPGEK